jgi:uncharacterized tellurite resistance protein B-like protein
VLAASLFFTIILILLLGLDIANSADPRLYVPSLAADALMALVSAVLLLKVMQASQARHRALVQRLQMIAELNHHIRNALEEIQLSAHTTHNSQLIRNTQTAVARIEWALREILPQNPIDSSQKPAAPQGSDREIGAGTRPET